MKPSGGYMKKVLRADLTRRKLEAEALDEDILQGLLGGAGLAAKILYDETPRGIDSYHPDNRLIFTTGPLNGTAAPGSGTFNVTSKGPQVGGFSTCAQANGHFGANLKFAGYDGIVIHGVSDKWCYLLITDNSIEIREASHLLGKDTFETEDALRHELQLRRGSVACIGPAGENGVEIAAIQSDKGHFVANGGLGAVMGAKKLKAIVTTGGLKVPVKETEKLRGIIPVWAEQAKTRGLGKMVHVDGTAGYYASTYEEGWLPVRNLTTNIFPEYTKYTGFRSATDLELIRKPCHACPLHHCHRLKIISGPYKGLETDEPEYESLAHWSSNTGITDLTTTIYLSDLVDRLGMNVNGAGFAVSLALECYEKGVINKKDTGGLELTWGNVEAISKLLVQMAKREGFGAILADGPMKAAQRIGKEAADFAVYLGKGNPPHGHDPRGKWGLLFSQAVTGNASIQGGVLFPFKDAKGLAIAEKEAAKRVQFGDCLVCCLFVLGGSLKIPVDSLNAVTGFDFTVDEALTVGERTITLLRLFNIREGLKPQHDSISPRLKQAPIDGPRKGESIAPYFDEALQTYYREMGWDQNTGKPLPETLDRLGLREK